ncbi:MAG: hypothetical protein ACRCSR_08885 [Bacteroidales bacterium]
MIDMIDDFADKFVKWQFYLPFALKVPVDRLLCVAIGVAIEF